MVTWPPCLRFNGTQNGYLHPQCSVFRAVRKRFPRHRPFPNSRSVPSFVRPHVGLRFPSGLSDRSPFLLTVHDDRPLRHLQQPQHLRQSLSLSPSSTAFDRPTTRALQHATQHRGQAPGRGRPRLERVARARGVEQGCRRAFDPVRLRVELEQLAVAHPPREDALADAAVDTPVGVNLCPSDTWRHGQLICTLIVWKLNAA